LIFGLSEVRGIFFWLLWSCSLNGRGIFFWLLLLSALPALAEKLDLNRDSWREIAERMVLVGEKRAKAIVSERKRHGPFSSLEEVADRVKGIGPKIIEKNRDRVTVKRPALCDQDG